MRTSLRTVRNVVLSAVFGVFGIGASRPALADLTTCICDNGEQVTTTGIGDDACDDACSIYGGGGRVATPADQDDEGDDDTTVVVPPRHPERPRPRR